MKEFKCKGEWWLPDNPEKKIPGDLGFNSGEGARLELIGSFDELFFTTNEKGLKTFGIQPKDYRLILGITSKGEQITLYHCMQIKSSISSQGLSTTIIIPSIIFIGILAETLNDLKFKGVSINYSLLEDWYDGKYFRARRSKNNKRHIIHYIYPKPIKAKFKSLFNFIVIDF